MRKKKWIMLASALAVIVACLSLTGAAQAATVTVNAAGLRSATPAISQKDCSGPQFGLSSPYYSDEGAYAKGSGSNIFFGADIDLLCEVSAPSGGGYVLFDLTIGGDQCLALNATTGYIYLHSSSYCDQGTASYLLWV
jgi:hypothetical protein